MNNAVPVNWTSFREDGLTMVVDSIFFVDEPRPTLFASFKWVGQDWDADMARMEANPKVREWWAMTDRMQESPHPGAKGSAAGPWWKVMEEVFYVK